MALNLIILLLLAVILMFLVRTDPKDGRIKVTFQRLSDDAQVPFHAHDGDAGFDFYAVEDIEIPAHGSAVIPTGITWMPESDCYMQLKGRSGLAFKNGIEFTSAGVIDAQYRGEIKGKLYNMTDEAFQIRKGDRAFQGVVIPLAKVIVSEGAVNDTERGTGGFGSTGGN